MAEVKDAVTARRTLDPRAPWKVLQYTATTSIVTAVSYGLYSTWQQGDPRVSTMKSSMTALNTTIYAGTFFGIREFIVSPLVLKIIPWARHDTRIQAFAIEGGTGVPIYASFFEMRTHKLLDSTLASATTGLVLATVKRGPKGMLPGLLGGALVGLTFQLAYNEVGISKLKFLARKSRKADEVAQQPVVPAKPPLMDRFLMSLGGQKMDDRQFIEKLRAEREKHLERIAVLEAESAAKFEQRARERGESP